MGNTQRPPAFGAIVFFGIVFSLGTYFTFASVQGDYGLFRRIQIEAEAAALRADVARLSAEVAALQNKTRRLSDDYLDLDLLDQQARDVLGLARGDEVIIR
jgi:cell division protein FtsB